MSYINIFIIQKEKPLSGVGRGHVLVIEKHEEKLILEQDWGALW